MYVYEGKLICMSLLAKKYFIFSYEMKKVTISLKYTYYMEVTFLLGFS